MRGTHKLTALKVDRLRKRGRYGDGGGLWLQIGETGGKSWVLRYMRHGISHWMGLGPTELVGLAEAREAAREARKLILAGVDPLDARRAERMAARLEAARAMTFRQCAEAYIAAHSPGWKSPKQAALWTTTLTTYAFPVIGALPVAAVDTALVMKILEPIWTVKVETASRVRGRCESVLDWATARGFRTGPNPARWRGHLDHLLAARERVQKVQHHAALPYAELPAFMAALRPADGTSARALEFTILTAARTNEALGARWSEIDEAEKVWTIPAERMKMTRPHKVPLSDRALEILASLPRGGEYVFPGAKPDKPLSNMALLMRLRRMGRDDLTAHGFRSSFRDWTAEQTSFPRDVAEMALAHAIGDKVEAAYRRGDLFAKRAKLMQAWAGFCGSPVRTGSVTPIRGQA